MSTVSVQLDPVPLKNPVAVSSKWLKDLNPKEVLQLVLPERWILWLNTLRRIVNAVAQVVGAVNLTAQQAAIGTTVVPNRVVGTAVFRISYYARITRAATTSSAVQLTLGWTDGGIPLTLVSANLNGNTTASFIQGSVIVSSDSAQLITYAVSYASVGAQSAQYALDVVVEVVQ